MDYDKKGERMSGEFWWRKNFPEETFPRLIRLPELSAKNPYAFVVIIEYYSDYSGEHYELATVTIPTGKLSTNTGYLSRLSECATIEELDAQAVKAYRKCEEDLKQARERSKKLRGQTYIERYNPLNY